MTEEFNIYCHLLKADIKIIKNFRVSEKNSVILVQRVIAQVKRR
jgi:hypothetical protein